MTYTKTLFFTGLFIAAVPFLGLPLFWKNILVIVLGLWVAAIATWAFIKHLAEGGVAEEKEKSSPRPTEGVKRIAVSDVERNF